MGQASCLSSSSSFLKTTYMTGWWRRINAKSPVRNKRVLFQPLSLGITRVSPPPNFSRKLLLMLFLLHPHILIVHGFIFSYLGGWIPPIFENPGPSPAALLRKPKTGPSQRGKNSCRYFSRYQTYCSCLLDSLSLSRHGKSSSELGSVMI